MKVFPLLVILVTLYTFVTALSADGKRTLVVLDDLSLRDTHSTFFKSLSDRGYDLTYVSADSSNIALQKYGDPLYDNLILFAPKSEDSIAPEDVVEFIDAGRNVLIAGGITTSDTIRDIASECGVEFAAEGTAVIDHHNFDHTDYDGFHTHIIADDFIDAPIILGSKRPSPVLFRGIGQDAREGPLNYPILTASSTAYSGHIDGKASSSPIRLLGKRNVLVSALQARNNARVTISGSLDLFSNAFFAAQVQRHSADGKAATPVRSGNEQFSQELTKWTFKERGLLRAHSAHHQKAGGAGTPHMYTIKDDIEYSIVIEEWSDGQWVPYKANDVQLEFIMLDPYVRTNLTHDGNGRYSTSFKLPDVYGVFTFRVDYHRPGYAGFTAIDRVPVRPYRHDQYERFIPSAFPYYAGAFSMLVGLFVFSVVFLYHQDDPKIKK